MLRLNMIDVAGAVSEIAISSIADDTNNNVWFQLDDDGMIEEIYVGIVDENSTVTPSGANNIGASLSVASGVVTLTVTNGNTTATTVWSAQMQIKNTQTGLVTYVDMGSGAALAANADNSEKTIAGNSINLYQVFVTINGMTTGIGNGLFAPGNDCTRGQIVTFLWRAYTGK